MLEEQELEILKKYQNQLQEMINYFHKGKIESKFIADDLDKIRAKISRKIGSVEGWFVGETEF